MAFISYNFYECEKYLCIKYVLDVPSGGECKFEMELIETLIWFCPFLSPTNPTLSVETTYPY